MQRFKPAEFLVILFILVGCAQLGLVSATTFNEQLAYGYSTVASIRTSTAQALDSQIIKVADAKQVLNLTDEARAALDSATVLSGTDVTSAQGKLTLATGIITEVQKYLVSKGVK